MILYGIFGASGFGREVMTLARRQLDREHRSSSKFELVFVDHDPSLPCTIDGHRVLNDQAFLQANAVMRKFNVAIANASIRRRIADIALASGVEPFNIVSCSSDILGARSFGSGAVLCGFSTMSVNVEIGRFFHANVYSYVAHDVVIGDFVTFGPSVVCNGNVLVEDDVYVGAGATIRQGRPGEPMILGRGAIIGMGAVVTRDVPPGTTVVGNPARPLKKAQGAGT